MVNNAHCSKESGRWRYVTPNQSKSLRTALECAKWRIKKQWGRLMDVIFDFFDPMGGMTA